MGSDRGGAALPGGTHTGGGPARLIEWTGERAVPWTDDIQVMYEHLHRYRLAATLAQDQDVLDLASGEGYGPALLAENARSVVGVEIDPVTVEHSRTTYQLPNLRFIEGSMLDRATVPHRSFDLVTCFEALEHVAEHEQLLDVVLHALRPGGVFVVSTPDRDIYSGQLHSENPYHIKELSRLEFEELLHDRFSHVTVMAQRVLCGSIGIGDAGGASGPGHLVGIHGQRDDWSETAPQFPYLLAFASSQPLPVLPGISVLMDVDEDLIRRSYDWRGAWLESERVRLEAALAEAQGHALEQVRQVRQESAAELASINEQLSLASEEVRRLEGELRQAVAYGEDVQDQLDAVARSRGWRAVTLYRRVHHGVTRRLGRK